MALTAKQKVERAHATIVRTPELAMFSSLVMMGDTIIDETCPTAATNGIDIMYGTEFVSGLKDAELVFVAMHEALHIGFRHLSTWGKLYDEDAELANAACDYVINLILLDLSKKTTALTMPKGSDGEFVGLLDEKYRGMSAGDVYKLLKEEDKQQQQQQQQQQQGQGSGESTPTPLRKHIVEHHVDDHDWTTASGMTPEQKEELHNSVDRAMRQGLAAAEKMGGAAPLEVKKLFEVQVDWREVLREYITAAIKRSPETPTWRRINRRTAGLSHYDVYMPSYHDDRLSRVVVAVDTSGSVYHMADTFISHVIKVCNDTVPEELHIMYWDSAVRVHEVYTPEQYSMVSTATRPQGGGGTDVRCVPNLIKKEGLSDTDCVIVLTDGEFFYGQGEWGSIPVLWAVVDPYDKKFVPEVGAKITINK